MTFKIAKFVSLFALSAAFAAVAQEPETPLLAPTSPWVEPGQLSLGVLFPGGGSLGGGSTVGMRYFLSTQAAITGFAQFGYSNASKATSFGVGGKYQGFLGDIRRASPYWFAKAGMGFNSQSIGETSNSDFAFGLGGGLGVEVFLIPEISTFVEVSFDAALAPSESMAIGTATSAIGLQYNFGL